jgi:8-amino-7-oxononanoate synthase
MGVLDYLDEDLAALDAAGRRRSMRRVDSRRGAKVELEGRLVLNFASNNYLGLADHPALAAAAARAADRWGSGATASRLIVGNTGEHEELEVDIARFHGRDAALLFNSGYHANLGVLTGLAGAGDLIVSDELNHASLVDGCRLSRATVAVYRHGDAEHARALLGQPARRRFLVSESLFSMDGDIAPLRDLATVALERDAALILDESHAVGALGPGGRGLAAASTIVPDVLIGTFGKSFGSFGGYAAVDRRVREWLISNARTFIFTTGLPPAVIGSSRAAVSLVAGEEGASRRASLDCATKRLGEALSRRVGPRVATPIAPILLGDERTTMRAAAELLTLGIYVQGIRPPTVPRGTSRLRIGMTASHSGRDIEALVEALDEVLFAPPTRVIECST